jgi:hypothetical protein
VKRIAEVLACKIVCVLFPYSQMAIPVGRRSYHYQMGDSPAVLLAWLSSKLGKIIPHCLVLSRIQAMSQCQRRRTRTV